MKRRIVTRYGLLCMLVCGCSPSVTVSVTGSPPTAKYPSASVRKLVIRVSELVAASGPGAEKLESRGVLGLLRKDVTSVLQETGLKLAVAGEQADVTLKLAIELKAPLTSCLEGAVTVTIESEQGKIDQLGLRSNFAEKLDLAQLSDQAKRFCVDGHPSFRDGWAEELVARALESEALTTWASSDRTRVATVAPPAQQSPPRTGPVVPTAPPGNSGFAQGSPDPNVYVLAVGVQRYRDLPEAMGAREDAQQFARMARTTMGVPEENLKLLVDDRALKSDLEKGIYWLTSRAAGKTGARLVLYFSGHGAPRAPSGEVYLVPFDGDPQLLDQSAVALESVMTSLSKSSASQVVAFVDSCFSGAGGRSVLPKGARPLVKVRSLPQTAHVSLFAASSGTEIAGPNASGTGGLFTHFVLDGVGRGAADIDGDRQVTLDELRQYVVPRVKREAGQASREQTPQLSLGTGVQASNVVLAQGVRKP